MVCLLYGDGAAKGVCVVTNQLNLRFVGEEISPLGIRSRELANIISAFEGAVAELVARQHPTLRVETIAVSLVDVRDASLGLTFDSDLGELVYPAGLKLATVIEHRQWSELPIASLKHVRKLLDVTKRWRCTAELRTVHNDITALAVLSPDIDIPDTATLYGKTTLIGDVKWVGGAEPRVMFTTVHGETLYCDVDEQLAKELAQHLYETVQLTGLVQWNFETLEVMEFEITEFVTHVGRPKASFEALRERFGDYFDDIDDVDSWADNVRQDGQDGFGLF